MSTKHDDPDEKLDEKPEAAAVEAPPSTASSSAPADDDDKAADRKTVALHFRITEAEYNRLRTLSEALGTSMATVARRTLSLGLDIVSEHAGALRRDAKIRVSFAPEGED